MPTLKSVTGYIIFQLLQLGHKSKKKKNTVIQKNSVQKNLPKYFPLRTYSTYMSQDAFGYKWQKHSQTELSISEGSEILSACKQQISLSGSWMLEEDTTFLGQRQRTFLQQ